MTDEKERGLTRDPREIPRFIAFFACSREGCRFRVMGYFFWRTVFYRNE